LTRHDVVLFHANLAHAVQAKELAQ
jgi:hypothetical protein